jgi:hypothetical protein
MISPQFHVVYDDAFTTILSQLQDKQIKPEDWENLLTFSQMLSIDIDEPAELNAEWLSNTELEERRWWTQQYRWNQVIPTVRRERHEQVEVSKEQDELLILQDDDEEEEEQEEDGDFWQPQQQRWHPVPNRQYYNEQFETHPRFDAAEYAALLDDFGLLSDEEKSLANLGMDPHGLTNKLNHQLTQMEVLESLATDEFGLLTTFHPLAFAVKVNNEDTPTYYQAMNGPDCLGFLEVMNIEMQQLEEKNPWDTIPIE